MFKLVSYCLALVVYSGVLNQMQFKTDVECPYLLKLV